MVVVAAAPRRLAGPGPMTDAATAATDNTARVARFMRPPPTPRFRHCPAISGTGVPVRQETVKEIAGVRRVDDTPWPPNVRLSGSGEESEHSSDRLRHRQLMRRQHQLCAGGGFVRIVDAREPGQLPRTGLH